MPILFVANAGGHTAQLMALSAAFPSSDGDMWVTNDTAQTRSLLRGRSVRYATYSAPRDLRSAARHLVLARRVLSEHEVDRIVSTGSSLAPPFMAVGRARGIACDFIDSATRVDAPSMSGRLVARLPGVRLFSQSTTWAHGRWRYGGQVWDRWQVGPERSQPSERPRVLVTTGTARDFAFAAMVDACWRVLDPSWDIVWQIGDHPHPPLPGRVVSSLSYEEMLRLTRSVDVVVSHAGVGSTILALEAGRRPVLFARTAARGEHVDDHQVELVGSLASRGLAEVVDPPEAFTVEHVDRAARSSVVERVDGSASWHF